MEKQPALGEDMWPQPGGPCCYEKQGDSVIAVATELLLVQVEGPCLSPEGKRMLEESDKS